MECTYAAADGERGILQVLDRIQIETADFELAEYHSRSLSCSLEVCISEKEIELFVDHPRFLLQACTMHFNKFLCRKEYGKTNLVERMFFSEEEIGRLWEWMKQIFQKPLLFKGRMLSDNRVVYRVDAKELTPLGEELLKTLDAKGLIPDIWRRLYLSDKVPPVEMEGMYYFDSFSVTQELHPPNSIERLLMDPYFRFMDISNIALEHCEQAAEIQKILSHCREAVIFVEKYKGQYLKRLCWKWK